MATPENLPEPWASFFRELDAQLTEEVCLYCVGGFAATIQYGLPRQTADVDVLSIVPNTQLAPVLVLAGYESALHGKYHVYIQHMGGIVTLPENHMDRAIELFPTRYQKLRLFGLDPYDLALSKLERNIQRDRDDVKYLFKTVPLDPETLERRYRVEQRPYMTNEDRHDLTLRLWTEMLTED